MSTDTKDNTYPLRNTGRWLRLGFFTLTVVGPAINALTARIRELADARQEEANTPSSHKVAPSPAQEKQAATKPSLSESLLELKDRPYTQELLRRSEELAEELRERGIKLSQVLADQGSRVTREMAERSSDLTREFLERGSKATQDLLKRSEKANRDLTKRSRRAARKLNKRSEKAAKDLTRRAERLAAELSRRSDATRDLARRNSTLLTFIGFAIGLLAAGIAAYVFMSRRMQQEAEEDQHILLSPNSNLNTPRTTSDMRPTGTRDADKQPAAENQPVVAVAKPQSNTSTSRTAPADAKLLGVVNTKRYYPVETPLDQLAPSEGQPMDIVYFSSEDEAREQGFSRAE